ncbi:mechanosensitive ion channel family protein [Bacteroidia bacterium]|nr:mechanosensitive ion channel family protein [Bacteroidia bacterium]MDB9882208.1 mechanosensitive ion channel family protein [Bacteroidia bacterium]
MNDINLEALVRYGKDTMTEYLPGIAAAIVTLIVGWWAIGKINQLFKRFLELREVEITLVPFLSSLVNFGLKIMLLVSVAAMLGIATTSFVTVLGAAGLAIGLALQGSLSNFAGGVLILLFKPFKVGDLIESDGVLGVVQSITVLNTILTTPADNTAILPNGQVANSKVLNYTKENNRRVDLTVGIGYAEDVEKAKKVLVEAMKKVPKVLEHPAPFVGVLGFGDSSVDLAVRPHALSTDYWDVYFAANEAIKVALDENNIEIPYPHQVEIRK